MDIKNNTSADYDKAATLAAESLVRILIQQVLSKRRANIKKEAKD